MQYFIQSFKNIIVLIFIYIVALNHLVLKLFAYESKIPYKTNQLIHNTLFAVHIILQNYMAATNFELFFHQWQQFLFLFMWRKLD